MTTHSDQLLFTFAPGSTITDLRPLPSNPAVRSIRVDGKAVARLRASDIDALGLAVGMNWTKRTANAVAKAIAMNRARQDAMKHLAQRARSAFELRERLAAKGHDASICAAIVKELIEDRWLDDRAHASLLIEQATLRRPASNEFLKRMLVERGIDPAIAESVIAEARQDSDSITEALELAQRKARSVRGGTEVKVRRISSLLARRGYDVDVIESVLRRLDLCRDDAGEC